jgi:uncharacterized membrane protein
MTISLPAWLPPELGVMLLAMTPLVELQGAIPFGVAAGLPIISVFLLGQLGNVVPSLLIYSLGNWWLRLVEREKGFFHRITHWVIDRTRRKMHGEFDAAKLVALMIFVALPFPGAGTWTGSLGAFLLGIPFRTAFPYIIAGNVINGVLVSLAVSGVVALAKVFL